MPYLEIAAKQDDIYAMIKLGTSGKVLCYESDNCVKYQSDELKKIALQTAIDKSEQGDTKAMMLRYLLGAILVG